MKNKFILTASALAVALASSALAQGTTSTGNAASGSHAKPATTTLNSAANTTTQPGNLSPAAGTSPNLNNGNQAANLGGPVNTVLPAGMGSYTYYANANTYYNPRTKVYYFQQNGEWKAATTSPKGVTLANGRTVQLQGESNVNGAGN